jgi:hypothetical protein
MRITDDVDEGAETQQQEPFSDVARQTGTKQASDVPQVSSNTLYISESAKGRDALPALRQGAERWRVAAEGVMEVKGNTLEGELGLAARSYLSVQSERDGSSACGILGKVRDRVPERAG